MDSHPDHPDECPRCQALEARIAELEQRTGHPEATFSLQALRITSEGWGQGWQLRPSPTRRHWMDQRPTAYQCQPMVVANQWGWQILCPTDVRATWNGGRGSDAILLEMDPQYQIGVKSQFGVGIVTFSPPWLFRTSPGWNLYAKGPGNRWKTNCVALEGIIETWWLPYTFTLNWKILEPGTVEFRRGESLGQLVPVPHHTFRGATAAEESLGDHPDLARTLYQWRDQRRQIARSPIKTHKLYLKAEGIADHLSRVPVPPIIGRDDVPPAP